MNAAAGVFQRPFVSPPPQWGDPTIVRDRLGAAVTGLVFDRGLMRFSALSPAHFRVFYEANAGPVTVAMSKSRAPSARSISSTT